jgi:cell wall-associated NlpC family hydrolase
MSSRMPDTGRPVFVRACWFVIGLVLLSAGARAQELPNGSARAVSFEPTAWFVNTSSEPAQQALSWEQRLQRIASDYIGTRYRLGGSSQYTGLDCSGLIKQIWQRLGLADLPHQAANMAKLGVPVQMRDIQVGDLVFFNTTGKQNSHVGVYVGDGRFVHASSVLKK